MLAWLDFGHVVCAGFWTNFAHFLRRRGLDEVFLSVFKQNIKKVLSRCFARVLVALLAFGNLHIISTSSRG